MERKEEEEQRRRGSGRQKGSPDYDCHGSVGLKQNWCRRQGRPRVSQSWPGHSPEIWLMADAGTKENLTVQRLGILVQAGNAGWRRGNREARSVVAPEGFWSMRAI